MLFGSEGELGERLVMRTANLPDDPNHPDVQELLPDLESQADQLEADTDLSKRQAHVLLLSMAGLSHDSIADIIGVTSRGTISDHYSAAKRHFEAAETLSDLLTFTTIAEGDHFMYKQVATQSWTPATYDHPEVDIADLSVYQHQVSGDYIYWTRGRTLLGSEMQVQMDLKRYEYAASTGRTADESTLIEEALMNPTFDHLADAVAVAQVLDETFDDAGYCLTRVPEVYYEGEYTTDDIAVAIECDLVDLVTAAHVLLRPHHDPDDLSEYGDLTDL